MTLRPIARALRGHTAAESFYIALLLNFFGLKLNCTFFQVGLRTDTRRVEMMSPSCDVAARQHPRQNRKLTDLRRRVGVPHAPRKVRPRVRPTPPLRAPD